MTAPLTVTLLVPGRAADPSGGILVLYEYANRLARRGHALTVLHGFLDVEPGPPERPWFDFDANVHVAYLGKAGAEALPEADVLMNVIPGIERRHGLSVLFVQGIGVFSEAAERRLFASPGRKVCVSRWAESYVRDLGVPEGDIAYVPNGLDHDTFRLTHPIERRRSRLAMLYNPFPVKGGDIGLAALARIKERLPGASATVFGTDPRPQALPEWIDYLERPSHRELAERVYGDAAVVLCPSRAEGFFLPGLEGMACGCAFATTAVGGIRDYAEHDVSALVSPVEDVDALADNAARLLTDDALRVRLATEGVRSAARFDWETSTDALEAKLVEWLAADGSP